MDYNTQRTKIRLPEYGRGVQQMVDMCKNIKNRRLRQRCAERIIDTMKRLHPEMKRMGNLQQRLWDHLAIMSNFELDIDYPVDVSRAIKMREHPAKVFVKKHKIPVKHYGRLVFTSLDYICRLPNGAKRDSLIRRTANQMKLDLVRFGNAAPDNDRVIKDIAEFTNGQVQIDPKKFKFAYIKLEKPEKPEKKQSEKGRKKKK